MEAINGFRFRTRNSYWYLYYKMEVEAEAAWKMDCFHIPSEDGDHKEVEYDDSEM